MNLSGDGYGGFPGDEYIPPEFVSLVLPGAITTIRNYLFAADPDRVFLNYRVRQYLTLLHSTDLVQFLLELDPRITYDVDAADMFDDSVFGLPEVEGLFFLEELGSPDASGKCFHKWKLTRRALGVMAVDRQSSPAQLSFRQFIIEDGLSSRIVLIGSGASFRFRDGAFGVGSVARVSAYARPTRELGDIESELLGLGKEPIWGVFGIGTPQAASEPFKTLWNLWQRHDQLPYRLGSLLVALILQTEEHRKRYA